MQDELAQLDRTYDSRMATANNAHERDLARLTDEQHRARLIRAIAIAHELYACRLDWIKAGCPASRVLECYQKLPPDAPADWLPAAPSRPIVPKRPTSGNIPGEIDPNVPVSCGTFKALMSETLTFALEGTPVPGYELRGTDYDREKYEGCYAVKKTIGKLVGEADVYLRQACEDRQPGQFSQFEAQRSPTVEVRLILTKKLEAAKGLALVVSDCVEQVRKGYAPGPPIPR